MPFTSSCKSRRKIIRLSGDRSGILPVMGPAITSKIAAQSVYILCHRSDLIQRGTVGDESVTGYRSVGWLQSGHAAEGTGLTDRSAGIGAKGREALVCRYRAAGAAGRAARDMLRVPGILRRTEGGSLGCASHGEFIHVRLADESQLRPSSDDPPPPHRIGWNKIVQDLRTAGRLQTFRADVVLDSHRNAGQRSGQLSVIDLLLYGFRLCQRALRIYRYVAVVFLFSRLDLSRGKPVRLLLQKSLSSLIFFPTAPRLSC